MRDDYRHTYLEAEGTTTIKDGDGFLHAIVVGTTSSGAIDVIDGVDDGSPTDKIAELKASVQEKTYTFNCKFAKGLYIGNPGAGTGGDASKITVIWR